MLEIPENTAFSSFFQKYRIFVQTIEYLENIGKNGNNAAASSLLQVLIRPCPEQASLNHCVRPPSRELLTGCPWELLYAVDLMINTESIDRF